MIAGGLVGAVSPGVGRVSEVQAQSQNQDGVKQAVSALYSPEQQRVMAEYRSAVDQNLLEFVNGVDAGVVKQGTAYKISDVLPRAVADIKNMTGIDFTSGFCDFQADNYRHVKTRHGKDGMADSSMASPEDIARAKYVLDNYDSVELSKERNRKYINKDGKMSDILLFKKAVDGKYVIVEATPDGRKKKLHTISMWLEANNKTDSNKLTDAGSLPPEPNVQNGLNEYLPSAENLSNNPDSVKNLNSISARGHEPDMPQGNETSDVKIGDVKKLVEQALGIPVREGQVRSKKFGGFISSNPYNRQKNDIIRAKYRNDIATLLNEFGHGTYHICQLTKSANYRLLKTMGKIIVPLLQVIMV